MILCYGSANPDLVHTVARFPAPGDDIPAENFTLTYGGGAANVAVALAAWDEEPVLAGHTLGEDPLADWLVADLQARGVDTSLLERRVDSETPHTVVIVTPDGERTIIGSRYEDVEWTPVKREPLSAAQAVVVDGYSGRAGRRVAELASELGARVVGLDVAPATAPACRLVVWSKHERSLAEAESLPAVVLTDGPRPLVVIEAGSTWELTPPTVEVRSVLGAGDAFGAMCALGVGHGWDLSDTVRRAVAASALVAASEREVAPPTLDAVEKLAKTLLT